MRRALRRVAHAVLAAGAVALPRPAWAQSLQPAAPQAQPSLADSIREGRGRLEEMKVELALLADPVTFACPLGVRTVEGNIEVRGQVPNESAHSRVLKIAQAHTHLGVLDVLQINSGLSPRVAGPSEDAVRQGAVEVLTETFGIAARGFEIRADHGVVSVGGGVNSVEEKLAVSRRLRQVRGCTAAANYLLVSPMMREGRMVTQVNANGSLVVPGQVLCLDGAGQDSTAVAIDTTRIVTPEPKPVAANSTLRRMPVGEAVAMAPTPPVPMPAPQQPAHLTMASSVPRPKPVPEPEAIALAPDPAPLPIEAPSINTTPTPIPTPPIAPVTTATPAKGVDLLAVPPVPTTWVPDESTTKAKPKPKRNAPTTFATARPDPASKPLNPDQLLSLPAMPLNAAETSVPAPVARVVQPATVQPAAVVPPPPAPVLQPAPVVAPVAQPTSSAVAEPARRDLWVEARPVATVRNTAASPAPPPGGWPSAHLARPVPQPYVTSGVVTFSDEPAAPAAPIQTASAAAVSETPKPKADPIAEHPTPLVLPSPSKLKQQVEKICGKLAKKVEIKATEHGLLVRVDTVDTASAQSLADKILQMPEMSNPKVLLEVYSAK